MQGLHIVFLILTSYDDGKRLAEQASSGSRVRDAAAPFQDLASKDGKGTV